MVLNSLVDELLLKSEQLLAHLNTMADKKEYEECFIEQINAFLGERQTIIDRLQDEAARQNSELKDLVDALIPKEACTRLISMEEEIAEGLQQVFNNIKSSRQLLQRKKNSRQRYRNPFSGVPRDGMFIDKRK